MLSKRSDCIQASITMAITAKAKALKKDGYNVLSFSAGEPDFDTPENIKQAAIKAINEGKTNYTPASGIVELKEAVCAKFKKDNNLDYSNKNIVISCGAKHSLYNVMMAIINPGDEVIIPSPYWVTYPFQVKMADGIPVFVETNDQSGFKITPEQLTNSITAKTKAIVLNSPSNPTGAVYKKSELMAIAEICVRKNIYILSDEIYEKLIYDDTEHISISSFSKEVKDLTIVVNGVSKAYSMTGWRIGYTASNSDIAEAMSKMQSHSTSNPTTPAQWASVEALNGSQSEVVKMREAFNERRKFIVDGLNNINGIYCLEPKGAFYVFPNIKELIGKKTKSGTIETSVDFCRYLLQESFIATVPGAGFGSDGFIRMSYATSLQDIKTGLAQLNEWVANLS